MWNTNGTVVDLFLKESVISGARKLLSDSNVHFDIVINDIQRNIEKENPPKEVIEQLQNRKGKYTIFLCFMNFTSTKSTLHPYCFVLLIFSLFFIFSICIPLLFFIFMKKD